MPEAVADQKLIELVHAGDESVLGIFVVVVLVVLID